MQYFLIFHTLVWLIFSILLQLHLQKILGVSNLFSEVYKFQQHTELCSKYTTVSFLEEENLLVECCFCLWNPGLHLPYTSCIICYHATQIIIISITIEVFHILQLFLICHNLFWGWLPWDSHYFSFSTSVFMPENLPVSVTQLCPVVPFFPIANSTRSSAYFTMQITFPPPCLYCASLLLDNKVFYFSSYF